MKQVLDKQKVQGIGSLANEASTSKLETLTREGNVVYLDYAKKQVEQLDKLNKTVGDSLGDKGELSKTLKEIKKSISEKPGAITEKVMGLGKGSGINATAGGTVNSTFKEKFGSLRGVLDTTGILKKGHNDTFVGGLMDKSLERREQKQQYVQDRVATQGSTFGSKKSFGESFEKSAKIQNEMQKNQETIKGLKDRGFKEGQIKRGGFYKKGVELEGQLAKVDTRFSDSFGGPNSDDNVVKPTRSTKTADPDKPKTVKAADVDDPNSTKKRAKIVKPAANDESFSGSSGLGAADMTEADIENQKLMQEQTELLRAIAQNTGGARKPNDAQKPKTEGGEGGGFLDGIMGMLGSGIMKAAKFIFNPKNLLKAFTKFLLPAMIIGSLINGIMDGFKAFMETGSIAEALIAGFGGILSFLTFGLIDAETIRSIVDWFSGFVTDYIIQPLKDFFGFLGESFDKYIAKPIMEAFGFVGDMLNQYIVEPIKKFFTPLVDFFNNIKDQVFGFLEGFGIPEVGFTIPIIDKKVSIGPFFPFKKETSKVSTPAAGGGVGAATVSGSADSAPKTVANQDMSKPKISAGEAKNILENGSKRDIEAFGGIDKLKQIAEGTSAKLTPVQPQTGNQVAAQSADSEMAKNAPASSSSTVIAPMSSVNNNSSSTYAIKPPVRNPNQGVQNQMQKRYGT